MKLILDLDGVLITTPAWRADEIDTDGYSQFNTNCVNNLNFLLRKYTFKTWLSSSRRKNTDLVTFNKIFEHRGVQTKIVGFLPMGSTSKTRKEEIEMFVRGVSYSDYLIIDDDQSLQGLEPDIKKRWVSTSGLLGFNDNKLKEALDLLQ